MGTLFFLVKWVFLLRHVISIFSFVLGFLLLTRTGFPLNFIGLVIIVLYAFILSRLFYHKTIVFQENELKITQIDVYSIRKKRVLIIKFGKNLSEDIWRMTAKSPPNTYGVDISLEGSLK